MLHSSAGVRLLLISPRRRGLQPLSRALASHAVAQQHHQVTEPQSQQRPPELDPHHDRPPPHPATASQIKKVDFNDTSVAYQGLSTVDIIRALAVFKACSNKLLVQHADTLLKYSYTFLGKTITQACIRATFFRHFCAGESAVSIKPRVDTLRARGVGGILDYAAECDLEQMTTGHQAELTTAYSEGAIQCRVYDYQSELQCDAHVQTFLDCIKAVKDVTPEGFAAIKITALGNPLLLERMSTCIEEVRKLFQKFDTDRQGYITRDQFVEGYNRFFADQGEGEWNVDRLLEKLDPRHTGRIDYIEWSNTLRLEDIPAITRGCRQTGPLKKAALSEEETNLMLAMRDRIDRLAFTAEHLGVRLMVDAEQTYFQPAIDNIIANLQAKYNTSYPAIFGTYQMYLKDSRARLQDDMARASRNNYYFAAKLVRGAYMISERKRAQDMGYPSPIHDTLHDTHRCYEGGLEVVLDAIARGEKVEILVASHNQSSIEKTLSIMNEKGLSPGASGVFFGQLLGMADHLTFTLGHHGYKAYKYVPYGKVGEVLPYLLRRVQENSDMLGGVGKDVALLSKELRRRLVGGGDGKL